MAGNPFLAMGEDFGASAADDSAALNPFLTGDFGTVNDNAFAGGNAFATDNAFAGGDNAFGGDNPFAASNPFSDFGATDFTAAVTTGADLFGISNPVNTTASNFFSTTINDTYEQPEFNAVEPLFSTAPTTVSEVVTSSNFFDTTIQEQHFVPMMAPSIQKPTDLGLTLTHSIPDQDDLQMYSSDDELNKPRRPPPPSRPINPETKDLILSVTGHMELTSTHLLDRIPPTRTPSPVSMRDLHSPSPIPDQVFGDFLTDGGEPKREAHISDNNEMNLFDVDDNVDDFNIIAPQNSNPAMDSSDFLSAQSTHTIIIENPSNTPSTIASQEASPKEEPISCDLNQNKPPPPRPGPPPARPTPPAPARPSRPAPPQKPPPPSVLPQRPPPIVPPAPQHPARPPLPPAPVTSSNDFSLFDAPISHAPSKSTNEDIMSLYSALKKQQEPAKQIDFLSDDINEDPAQPEKVASPPTETPQPVEHHEPEPEIEPEPELELDKPQPMDITPNTEETPQDEQMAIDSTNFPSAEEEPPAAPNAFDAPDVVATTLNSTELAFDTQAIPTSVESSFNVQPTNAFDSEYSNQSPFGIPEQPASRPATSPPVAESNPFSCAEPANDIFNNSEPAVSPAVNIFGVGAAPSNSAYDNTAFGDTNAFGGAGYAAEPAFGAEIAPQSGQLPAAASDAFDAFSAKFESTANKDGGFDAFGGSAAAPPDDAWGNSGAFNTSAAAGDGFGVDDSFDSFLTLNEPPPVPSGTPAPFGKGDSQDSDEGNFNVVIKPRDGDIPFSVDRSGGVVPALAPPPRSPAQPPSMFTEDTSPRFNPFDKGAAFAEAAFGSHQEPTDGERPGMERADSQESPPTPLFDEDTSQPLEDFPRIHYDGPGWEVQLRQPNKKKITGQRFWKKIFVKLVYQGDNPVVQLFNSATDKEPFQELPLQACYSVSEIAAQQYDQYGKIFTVKLQYVFYKERPGVRPGQVTKAERITNKLSQFAAYAIQGDYQGVKEFGSDLKKLGLPVEHAPQVSQLFKIGSTTFEDMKQFSMCIEEALFRLNAHRDRALHYKMEEVQVTGVDELYVEQDAEGHILKQIARVRLFFLGFLSGMPDVELGVNDMWRQGKEVVGRHDIIPVATEEWIRLEGVEFHSCVQPDEYQRTRIIRFKPPDACYIELMRFRIRPPKNRELPLQLKATMCVTGNKVELRADALVPGFTSRSLGQVPCEDVMIRFPIPECWIYLFRVEKHFRYGSVKSAHRRTGKIKGIERFLGAVDNLQESLIEVTSGQAKYEHQHRSIVWRMPRLPKEGQGAYTTHNLVCRMALTSYDQIPEKLADWCYVEFTMPATQASHTTVRSVSLQNHDSDDPPEKYVRYLARHEYKVGIEHTQGEGPNAYSAATMSKPLREEPVAEAEPTPAPPSSDSDSD